MCRLPGFQPFFRLILCVLLAGAPIGAMAAEPITPPGSRIVLVPPPGFTLSNSFRGFENRELGASIGLMEFPGGGFDQTIRGMSPDALAKRGLRAMHSDPLTIEGINTFLTRVEQQANNTLLEKWIFVLDAKSFIGMVVVTVPKNAARHIPESAVRAVLASVRVDTTAKTDPRTLLPYVFDRGKRFQYENVMGGHAVLLKESPPPPKGRADDAAMLITYKRQVIPPQQREKLGELALSSFKAMKVDSILSRKPVTVGGLQGYEYRATARDPRTTKSLSVVMVALFSADHYFILMGFGEPPAVARAMADIQAVVASFRVKP